MNARRIFNPLFASILLASLPFWTFVLGHAKEEEKKQHRGFDAVSRIHWRFANQGESALTLSSFILLPENFFLLGVAEFFSEKESGPKIQIHHKTFEVNTGRPFSTLSDKLGWVARSQFQDNGKLLISGGLQWNISENASFNRTQTIPWKSFIQAFAHERQALGEIDFFHWYQFNFLQNRLLLRGNTALYLLPDDDTGWRAEQDLILPIDEDWQIYLRHYYKNKDLIDDFRKLGSQLMLGIRFSF